DDQALGVTYIGEVAPELQRLNKPPPRLAPAAQVEGKHGAGASGQVLPDEWRVWTGLQTRIAHPLDSRVLLQKPCNPDSVLHVPPLSLVAECTTMSAPNSMGRQRYGVAKVLSIMSGAPMP